MERNRQRKKFLFFAGLILIALSLFIEGLLISLRYDRLWSWYDTLRSMLIQLEEWITNLDRSVEFILIIMLLFVIKSFFPIYTTSTVCLLTGIVFPLWAAIPINMIGLGIQFTIKYFWGKAFSAGYAWKLLQKNNDLRNIIRSGGKANAAVLFAIRMVPIVPVNLVSSVYGSFDFGYVKFIIISLLGFLPKLISFTVAGTNMFDPLSVGFLLPLMLISFFTGLACLSANGMWNAVERFVSYFNRRSKEKGGDDADFEDEEQPRSVKEKDKTDYTLKGRKDND